MLQLPKRELKPRTHGVTSVNDVRLTVNELESILEDYGTYFDIAKLGIGIAMVLPRLKEKIAIYQRHNVEVYFGGTLFEKFYHAGKLDEYLKFLGENNIGTIEVSCGTIDIAIEERVRLVEELKQNFEVIAEVGSKDPNTIMPPSQWIGEISALFDAGSKFVITEGRDSGRSGIYRPSGEVREGLISDIIANTDVNRLIFEAPSSSLQMHFINLVGPNVNLGNINPVDVIVLEAQRQGLRSETFHL